MVLPHASTIPCSCHVDRLISKESPRTVANHPGRARGPPGDNSPRNQWTHFPGGSGYGHNNHYPIISPTRDASYQAIHRLRYQSPCIILLTCRSCTTINLSDQSQPSSTIVFPIIQWSLPPMINQRLVRTPPCPPHRLQVIFSNQHRLQARVPRGKPRRKQLLVDFSLGKVVIQEVIKQTEGLKTHIKQMKPLVMI